MAKFTTFMISLVIFLMFIIGGIMPLLASINDKYSPIGYNQTSLDAYNKLNDIQSNTEDIKDKATTLQSKSGVLDILGGFFESAYDTLKIAANSFGIFNIMANQAAKDSGLGDSNIFVTGLILIAIIVIFIGIILSSVIKREM